MLLRKTPQNKRTSYTYTFYDANGKPESVTLHPGENGVTELDIKRLHAADDSEIYYNLKAIHPEMRLTSAEKKALRAEKDAWAARYIEKFQETYGYTPHPDDVADAIREAFSDKWLLSLDEMLADGDGDKSAVLTKMRSYSDALETEVDDPLTERMNEILSTLSEKQQVVYRRVLLGGEKKKDVAIDLGISDTRVSQIAKEITKILREDEILKKLFGNTSDSAEIL